MLFTRDEAIARLRGIGRGLPVRIRSPHTRFGEHKSVFRNVGFDFQQFAEYDPEKHAFWQIAWDMTDDTDEDALLVREYRETRVVPVVLVCDVSHSMLFGVDRQEKAMLLLELAGAFAFTAVHDQDPVGAVLFTDQVVQDIPPKPGKGHGYYIASSIYSFWEILEKAERVAGQPTNFFRALSHVRGRYTRPSVVAILSDFVGGESLASSALMRSFAARHDVMCCILDDPNEFARIRGWFGHIPDENPETGVITSVSVREARRKHHEILKRREQMIDEFKRINVSCTVFQYGDHYQTLTKLLAERR